MLADALERQRTVDEHDSGLHPLDVAGAIEQGIQQLFRTERPGLSRGEVQAGGLGMTVADLVYAGAEDRQRRVGIGVVEPENRASERFQARSAGSRTTSSSVLAAVRISSEGTGRNHSRLISHGEDAVGNDRTTKGLLRVQYERSVLRDCEGGVVQHSQLIERRPSEWLLRGVLALLATIGVALSVALLPAAALAASSPSVIQTSYSNVTSDSVKLEAQINPGGSPTTYYFIYKQADAAECEDLEGCGPETTHGGPLTGDTQQEVSPAEVTGLEPNTTYIYWLIAKNANGTAVGNRLGFTTPPAAPLIEAESMSNVTRNDATLEATINPEGPPNGVYSNGAYYQFQIVTNTSEYLPEMFCSEAGLAQPVGHGCGGELGKEPDAIPLGGKIGRASTGQPVTLDLAGAGVTLAPDTTYHYRVLAARGLAEEEGGIFWEHPSVIGPDHTFTTLPASVVPVVDSVSLSNLTSSDATLEAQIDTEGLSTVYQFKLRINLCPYSECIGYKDVPLPSGLLLGSFADQAVSLDLNSVGVSLAPGVYEYALSATSTGGHVDSPWQTLSPAVLDPPAPSASTQSGTGPPAASSGSVQPAGSGGAGSGGSSSSSTPGVQSPGPKLGKTTKLEPFENGQKLSKALKLCDKKPKSKRPSCKRQAEKKYAATGKHHG